MLGILNVTPDSFSDGGRYTSTEDAVHHGMAMARAGADYVDVGGESTRPGAERVDTSEELRRVLPVINALAVAGVAISVDTTRAGVAAAAIEAGASLINDVSGGLADPDMAEVVADSGVPWVLMHWRGHSCRMDELARYTDVVSEVRDELLRRVEAAVAAGVEAERQLILDPGFGFAKHVEHDTALLGALRQIVDLGLPVLIGASRKRFLGRLIAHEGAGTRPVGDRDAATVATSVLAAGAGVWGVRVHNVPATVDALRVVAATRPDQQG